MISTPETDAKALHHDLHGNPYMMAWIPTDFARQLEIQRNEAQARVTELEQILSEKEKSLHSYMMTYIRGMNPSSEDDDD